LRGVNVCFEVKRAFIGPEGYVCDGKLFIKERVELAREQSAFWHNYKWLNPATKEIEPQTA
jgi:hypothetical protein